MRLFEALISMIKHPKTGESQTYSAGREDVVARPHPPSPQKGFRDQFCFLDCSRRKSVDKQPGNQRRGLEVLQMVGPQAAPVKLWSV